MNDGFFDGERDLTLIGAEINLAGMRPGDGAAANGGAEELGEGGMCHVFRGQVFKCQELGCQVV